MSITLNVPGELGLIEVSGLESESNLEIRSIDCEILGFIEQAPGQGSVGIAPV